MARKFHILVTNDDGPPSLESSPYVHPLISTLRAAGHTVSVCLPDQQRSWIGKAQFKDKIVSPQRYEPSRDAYSGGEGASSLKGEIQSNGDNASSTERDSWFLIDGTPATCTQLGLFHLFKERRPIDVVVSGPNYGRNVTALFSLSSGTLGGAMEAATFGCKAIALSFAFWGRVHDPAVIEQACLHSARIIDALVNDWGNGVDVYSVNVPVADGVGERKTIVAPILGNQWRSGSCFEQVVGEGEEEPAKKEREVRDGTEQEVKTSGNQRSFRWAPKFQDVQDSIVKSEGESDGKVVVNGQTSITPLKANFMHVPEISYGEFKLISREKSELIHVILEQDDYLNPLIKEALSSCLPKQGFVYQSQSEKTSTPNLRLLRIQQYEDIDFSNHVKSMTTSLANAYVIRKALIRKNFLWHTISSWWTKHPGDRSLKGHVPLTVDFELDYAEYLDEALLECWELNESFVKDEIEWWVLKPAMSDQGHGIRMFSSEAELRAIFEEWEESSEDEDAEDETGQSDAATGTGKQDRGIMTSQLRHFVAQKYVSNPLLLEKHQGRKFHIRTYVLAVGALKVYVYRDMLALFAPLPYVDPKDSEAEPRVHLTNTCLQGGEPVAGSVHRFHDLPDDQAGLSSNWKQQVCQQIELATSTLFEAAAREQMIHFQTVPNSFEVFGVDWLVDSAANVWLLEINAFPDFKQSGQSLRSVVRGFWDAVIRHAVAPFFGLHCKIEAGEQMAKVLDIDLGRR